MRDEIALQAASTPDGTALVDAATDESWTFAEFDTEVQATAGRLAALGVESGDRVAVLMETRPAFARLVFACARLGAVLVPLNARLSRPELETHVDAVRPVLVVCEADTVADADELDAPAVSVDAGAAEGSAATVGDFAARTPDAIQPADLAWDDTRALMFTSGTTGDPKAVRLTYGNFAASAVASAFRLGVLPEDRWCCPLSMYHMGGLSVVLRSALYGTTAVLTRGFDANPVRDALAAYDCTGVSLVPTMLRRLLDAGGVPDGLRFALVGGAPTPPELAARALDAGVPVCLTYGMTETTSQVATLRPEQASDAPAGGGQSDRLDTVGRPLLGTEVTVVDGDGSPLPAGEEGELVVSGPTVTPGYLNSGGAAGGESGANAGRFCEHGLRTGDRGFVDDEGYLHVRGRQADRIITGGENVDPERVEDVLADHSRVTDAAVVGVPDDEWGERVGALVVLAGDESAAPATGDAATGDVVEELLAFAEDRLADYERPRIVVAVDSLPRTASGTVDREAAVEELADEN
ncbi:class I adenylate-forming enzyme family protein [Halobacterium zhouii]|uniref:class I adenylate-forming enzyme family protein n=1 Tax=Halobacterium zhouii TaxID=2902624 RepID=UPI001E374FC5|nr:class I adenylate-forming enzyme family protein [Halobacterium zhouii]